MIAELTESGQVLGNLSEAELRKREESVMDLR